jgi:hypothetical protein
MRPYKLERNQNQKPPFYEDSKAFILSTHYITVKLKFVCISVINIKEYRLLKGTLFTSLVLSMATATKKEKKRRSLPLEGWRLWQAHNKP